jgi:hypothetical protein
MKVRICSKNLMENSIHEYLLFLIQVIVFVLCSLECMRRNIIVINMKDKV